MKWVLRRLGPDETDWEKLVGLCTLTPLFLFLIAVHHWHVIPDCLFQRLTGLPCPTCGSVRAWELLAAGHFIEAFLTQPLMVLVEIGAIGFMVYSWTAVVFKTRRIRIENVRTGAVISGGVLLLALNWLYLLWRALFSR